MKFGSNTSSPLSMVFMRLESMFIQFCAGLSTEAGVWALTNFMKRMLKRGNDVELQITDLGSVTYFSSGYIKLNGKLVKEERFLDLVVYRRFKEV